MSSKIVVCASVLLLASASLAAPASASGGGVTNGGFETGDLAGWTTVQSGNGNWSAYANATSPISKWPVAPPPVGTFAAIADQDGPGTHILLQDLTVPAGTNATLSFLLAMENRAAEFHSPVNLSHLGGPNQQLRIDILRTDAPADSVAPADVLANVYQTQPGDPSGVGFFRVCFPLASFEGQDVKVRFAVVQNKFYFQGAIDDVGVVSDCAPTPPRPSADLAATSLFVPPNVVNGSEVSIMAQFANLGTGAVREPFEARFLLDGTVVGHEVWSTGLPAGDRFTSLFKTRVFGVGTHVVEVVIDAIDNVSEANESNNVLSARFNVTPGPDARVALAMRPVLVPTEAGPVRHPLGRHEATLEVCNDGSGGSEPGSVGLVAIGGANGSPGVGSASLPSRTVPPLAPGECARDTFRFDAPGVVGDFTLVATLLVRHDHADGNEARATGFRHVGDQGGVVAPGGVKLALEHAPYVGEAQRLADETQRAAHRTVQQADEARRNATRQAEGIAANATHQAGRTVAEATATLQNLTSDPTRPVMGVLDPILKGLGDAISGDVPGQMLNATEETVCRTNTSDLCRASRGDPGVGAFRPCGPAPSAQHNLLAWAIWHSVHVYEDRAVRPPATTPMGAPWPLPPTALPIPEEAPRVCVDRWAQLREAAG